MIQGHIREIINRSQAFGVGGETNSSNEPVGLQVSSNQTLALLGGDVFLAGGNLTATGGRVEIGSVAANGEVSLSSPAPLLPKLPLLAKLYN